MNICIISRSLPLHRPGGLEYHTLELAQGLVERGHNVFLVTTRLPQNASPSAFAGIKIEPIPSTLCGRYNLRFFLKIKKQIKSLNQRYKFSILHAQGFGALTLKSEELIPPLVVTIHGTLFSETALAKKIWQQLSLSEKAKALWQNKTRLFLIPLYQRMLKRAEHIIVDSQFSKAEICRELPALAKKISVVPLGIDPKRYPQIERLQARQKLKLPMDKPIFFTVGRLHKLKGIQVVLKALHIITAEAKNKFDFLYFIGGEGGYERELLKLAERFNLTERAKFVGRIPDEDLPYYYASADAFIYPELSQPAFGLVALEALLCGTPVIAANSGAIPEVVHSEVGAIYPPHSDATLAEILKQVLSEPNWLGERQNLCREYAIKNFSYSDMISAIEKVYHEVILARGNSSGIQTLRKRLR